ALERLRVLLRGPAPDGRSGAAHADGQARAVSAGALRQFLLRETMSRLRLALGCWNYDRTRALLEGRIQPDGIDLTYLNMPVEETFFRMLRHQEFDMAAMSLC